MIDNAVNLKAEKTEPDSENNNKKLTKSIKNKRYKKAAKNANSELNSDVATMCENDKDKPKSIDNKSEEVSEQYTEAPVSPQTHLVFLLKYKYNEGQWSPINKSGQKKYDRALLKQISDSVSNNEPDEHLLQILQTYNLIKKKNTFVPMSTSISKSLNNLIFPSFGNQQSAERPKPLQDLNNTRRDVGDSGKGSVKLTPNLSGNCVHKPIIHVSLSLREDVKLNETANAWKPKRLTKDTIIEEEGKTEIIYKKFRGILNKLTPQKFDTLLKKVKELEINNKKCLEGIIDLVFEKAIDEPNFSKTYANLCKELITLKVPADNEASPDQFVNFKVLIINRCQKQFVTEKTNETITDLEKELSECTDSFKRKQLSLKLDEENRKIRMRSVGNVRFIGELYKLKMLTSRIMVFCMNHLVDKLEEEKLECLCKLLTTIGEQVEGEIKHQIDAVFRKLQVIVDTKSDYISSRVRFMIQDVIDLRKRRWVVKSVVDLQPKMMDQIQKEAEQHRQEIEIMNWEPKYGRKEKRSGDIWRQDTNNSKVDGKHLNTNYSYQNSYTVDTSKLKAATSINKQSLGNIKLAPSSPGWNYGSAKKNRAQVSSNSLINLPTKSTNMYSILADNNTSDHTSPGGSDNENQSSALPKSQSESYISSYKPGSTFVNTSHAPATTISTLATTASALADTESSPAITKSVSATILQEPLTDSKKKPIKSVIDLLLINLDDKEVVHDVEQMFPSKYHAALVLEILNVALEKSTKDIVVVSKCLLQLVSSGTISKENLLAGFKELFDCAPDLIIDIPMLYDYLGKLIAPQIESQNVTFVEVLGVSDTIISAGHGYLFIKGMIKILNESMGPSFVKTIWRESGLQLQQWMREEQVSCFIKENKFEFLTEDSAISGSEDSKVKFSPTEVQKKLLHLMDLNVKCKCIRGWIKDNIGESSKEDWFMRSLIQALCQHAIGCDQPNFNENLMDKYSGLIKKYGISSETREANCLIGIQQLIHRLEHPRELTLQLFQYLYEQNLISVEGFLSWEKSLLEPEGKGVMMKALTSFFASIREVDSEDCCSET